MNPFEELLAKLARAEVRFVLVGGMAVLMQGFARNTNDIDILIEASEENARRLIEALAAWGEGAGGELHLDELATPQSGAIRVVEDFPLDVFTSMRARALGRNFVYEDLATDALVCEVVDRITIQAASIPRLLDLKAGTGRAKDRIDTDMLTEILRGLRERQPPDLKALRSDPMSEATSDQGDWPSSPDQTEGER